MISLTQSFCQIVTERKSFKTMRHTLLTMFFKSQNLTLCAVFEEYGIEYPGYEFHCTLAASRRCLDLLSHQLHFSAAACGYDMENHHHALCDAEACAAIALKIL